MATVLQLADLHGHLNVAPKSSGSVILRILRSYLDPEGKNRVPDEECLAWSLVGSDSMNLSSDGCLPVTSQCTKHSGATI